MSVLNAMSRIAQLIYLLLPAYVANMTPPFTRFWRGWNRPVSERWLGSHKTIVGGAAGVVAAVVTAFIQSRIEWTGALIDYDRWLLAGLLLGVGAIGGDMAKSFVKRRMKIAPGGRWIPADQLDFGIGALVLVSPIAAISWLDAVIALAVTFAGDIVINQIAYRLQVKDTAW